jgi:hypothetical protein
MKTTYRAVSAAAAAVLFGAVGVAPASAIDDIKPFGQQETLTDFGSEIGYTVMGLTPSADAVPYPVAGTLYEATTTVDAIQGNVTPVIPFFNARAENGDNYRVLANVFVPQGLSGGALGPGGRSSGKLYFDVVGAVPNSVVYNDGSHDLLGWIAVPNGPVVEGSSSSGSGGGGGAQGVTGSTGPNFTGPSTTAGGENAGSSVEGSDEGSGGGGSGSAGVGGAGAGG